MDRPAGAGPLAAPRPPRRRLRSSRATPIKIGLLLPYTGVIAINGQETSKGVEFYLAKIGGNAGGREIQVIKEDDLRIRRK